LNTQVQTLHQGCGKGVTRGYKDGLQPETLADGNWLVKQNQPVSKIEIKSDTNGVWAEGTGLRSSIIVGSLLSQL